jgi:hypothetical protein
MLLSIFVALLFFSCSFSGENPKIVSVSISNGQRITGADNLEEITITFSKPMNCYITEKNISISGYYGTVHFVWSNSNRTVCLILGESLEAGYAYTLEIESGCESAGGYDLGEGDRYYFYTYTNESEFTVVSTSPGDGETIAALDGVEIVVEFSQPVRYTTIYDKVSIQPPVKFNYSFSAERNTLFLDILQHLDSNQNFTVRIDKELGAIDGKALKEDRSFSFNTVESAQAFIVQDAFMIDASGSGTDGSIQFENSTYPDVITGVEKDMELQIRFNTGFYLNTIENAISITPPIDYSLEKGDSNVLRVIFDESMTPEETYRASLNRSTSNIYGVPLDRDYAFEWTVNGNNSLLIRPLKISILTPEDTGENGDDTGAQNTVIFDGNVVDHNRTMPYRFISVDNCNLVSFEIQFSPGPDTELDQQTDPGPRNSLDVYRSLGKFSLDYQYGDFILESGKLIGYDWKPAEDLSGDDYDTLTVDFELKIPLITDGTAFYKFIIQGGEDGIMDTSCNYMKDSIEIYVIYDFTL